MMMVVVVVDLLIMGVSRVVEVSLVLLVLLGISESCLVLSEIIWIRKVQVYWIFIFRLCRVRLSMLKCSSQCVLLRRKIVSRCCFGRCRLLCRVMWKCRILWFQCRCLCDDMLSCVRICLLKWIIWCRQWISIIVLMNRLIRNIVLKIRFDFMFGFSEWLRVQIRIVLRVQRKNVRLVNWLIVNIVLVCVGCRLCWVSSVIRVNGLLLLFGVVQKVNLLVMMMLMFCNCLSLLVCLVSSRCRCRLLMNQQIMIMLNISSRLFSGKVCKCGNMLLLLSISGISEVLIKLNSSNQF